MESVKDLPRCPSCLPEDLIQPLKDFAKLWKSSRFCPVISDEVLIHWDSLLDQWIVDRSLPLFVRRPANGRGKREANHVANRDVVFSDNSPAQWAYSMAYRGEKPRIDQIRQWLKDDKIPVAMIRTKEMNEGADLKCALSSCKTADINRLGWKLAHIEGIRLKGKGPITQMSDFAISGHFKKFMSPSNMFLVPKVWAGIGELAEVSKLFLRLS